MIIESTCYNANAETAFIKAIINEIKLPYSIFKRFIIKWTFIKSHFTRVSRIVCLFQAGIDALSLTFSRYSIKSNL